MLNEVHRLGSTLVLLTRPSLQASALLQYLKSTLDISGKVQNIHRIIEDAYQRCLL